MDVNVLMCNLHFFSPYKMSLEQEYAGMTSREVDLEINSEGWLWSPTRQNPSRPNFSRPESYSSIELYLVCKVENRIGLR